MPQAVHKKSGHALIMPSLATFSSFSTNTLWTPLSVFKCFELKSKQGDSGGLPAPPQLAFPHCSQAEVTTSAFLPSGLARWTGRLSISLLGASLPKESLQSQLPVAYKGQGPLGHRSTFLLPTRKAIIQSSPALLKWFAREDVTAPDLHH